ncbi:hypothetical protein DOQ08_00956 [Marinobacter litoralis]|uniref:Uncharacterized protein n=1 Tax=Marinobacter litoralis TaxID=187981 RepID=A0A3M2RLQ8_9GAMM|nr:hypothetical protein [Marinobacter litoralis]RMJ06270.1 hypothetical protein DOQ08_00956 [Marinobacter litoralis]
MIRWAVGAMCILTTGLAAAATFEFVGTAQSIDSQKELYEERHQVTGNCSETGFEPREHSVTYHKGSDDRRFAFKTLQYGEHPSRPRVDFSQPDFGESLEISYPDSTQLIVDWQTPVESPRRFRVSYDNRLVVDAGFDQFVRANWQDVTAGKSIPFRFLAPTRGDHYGFVLEPAPNTMIDADVAVQIRPTSLVLRFLVDPIILGYNQNGALTHYQGLTNIRANRETNYTALLRYRITQYPGCDLTL